MQFNGPMLPEQGQDHRSERSREAGLEPEAQSSRHDPASPAGLTHGDQLDRRLARDRLLREIHTEELQTQLNGAHWLETHARSACVVAGLISIPLWISVWMPPGYWPSAFEWLMEPMVHVTGFILPLGSICAVTAWAWRKWTLRKAATRYLEVRDPARPAPHPPAD